MTEESNNNSNRIDTHQSAHTCGCCGGDDCPACNADMARIMSQVGSSSRRIQVDDDKPSAQVGGTHYSDKGIQPIEYINANNLGYHVGNVIKYVTRYKDKNGLEDLLKAEWYIQDLIKQTKGN